MQRGERQEGRQLGCRIPRSELRRDALGQRLGAQGGVRCRSPSKGVGPPPIRPTSGCRAARDRSGASAVTSSRSTAASGSNWRATSASKADPGKAAAGAAAASVLVDASAPAAALGPDRAATRLPTPPREGQPAAPAAPHPGGLAPLPLRHRGVGHRQGVANSGLSQTKGPPAEPSQLFECLLQWLPGSLFLLAHCMCSRARAGAAAAWSKASMLNLGRRAAGAVAGCRARHAAAAPQPLAAGA